MTHSLNGNVFQHWANFQDWESEVHDLIRQYKAPLPYLDDDYISCEDLYQSGHFPEEVIQILKDCGEL